MFGKISPADFRLLKENLNGVSDEKLEPEIKGIWDDARDVPPMDWHIKAAVLNNIHRQMGASRRILRRLTRTAVAIMLPLLISLASYYYFSNRYASSSREFVVMAEGGHKTKVLLPDGSRVWLNSESRLTYSSDFNANNRMVKLEGEAFFEVNKSTNRRFIVEASIVNVVVYGTSFNVAAYPNEETIEVSLVEGRVGIENNLDNRFLAEIHPNQKISVLKGEQKWRVQDCDAQLESLWTQNKLKFENASATEVFHKLERWYGMNIHIENPDRDVRYGFTLKSESLQEMLGEINKITPINYVINGEEVNISYK
jgi:ferric-dicitrate binding protein FerR (iron transport regulator)